MYKCVNSEWDSVGDELYQSRGEFLEMCLDVFSEAPTLHENGLGEYEDVVGTTVLVPA